ncbi:hypothetical protein PybrP1_008905 [[Pythium] brassicae (nom. inval.)]|nr:hypothetical protein PybrP1_008905 [[Pythium] brassicae (nom. inval.)]
MAKHVASTETLKEFELTLVVYDQRDPLGFVLALITLTPRDLDAFAALVGQLANEVLNQVLKRTIQQSRPVGARKGGAGMPSAHAQFVAFFAAYVIAYTYKRLNEHRRLEQLLTIASAAVLAVAVCFSRVRLGYHTKEQVVVGALVGTCVGLLWHSFIAKISVWLFPLVAQSQLGQSLYVRDISAIPDLIVYQHQLCHPPAEAAKRD